MYTHTRARARAHTQTDRQTRAVRDNPGSMASRTPTHIHGLSSLSLSQGTNSVWSELLPPLGPPPLQGNSLTLAVYCSTISRSVVLHRAVAGNYAKGGWKEKKKCVCVCIADSLSRIGIFPSKGSWGHGIVRRHGMCMHASFQFINFFIFFFILFRTLSLHRRGMPS